MCAFRHPPIILKRRVIKRTFISLKLFLGYQMEFRLIAVQIKFGNFRLGLIAVHQCKSYSFARFY